MKGITGALLAGALVLGLGATAPMADAKTFYWISHGSPADPVWTYFLAGAEQWAADTGNTVNTSFHNGDVPRSRRRCAPRSRRGPTASSPRAPIRAAWSRSSTEANEAGIPIININTPDPTASFDAYVGGDNVVVRRATGRSTWSTTAW